MQTFTNSKKYRYGLTREEYDKKIHLEAKEILAKKKERRFQDKAYLVRQGLTPGEAEMQLEANDIQAEREKREREAKQLKLELYGTAEQKLNEEIHNLSPLAIKRYWALLEQRDREEADTGKLKLTYDEFEELKEMDARTYSKLMESGDFILTESTRHPKAIEFEELQRQKLELEASNRKVGSYDVLKAMAPEERNKWFQENPEADIR